MGDGMSQGLIAISGGGLLASSTVNTAVLSPTTTLSSW